jgi:hypothetical protein
LWVEAFFIIALGVISTTSAQMAAAAGSEGAASRRESLIGLDGVSAPRERCLSVSTSNALDNFAVLEALLRSRRLVLLLDYDGTLTPIVNDPSKALLSEEVS